MRNTAFDAFAGVEGDNASAARNQVHQALESGLDRVQIFIYVRMIELDRSQNYSIGKIVQELRAFVEERGIVLVAFKNEILAISQVKAAAKIFRNSANQKGRMRSRVFKNPGEHGRRRSLAVGAGYDQYFFAAQKFIVQKLWQRAKRDALIEHMFEFNIAARDRVAHNHEIRPWL